MINSKSLVMGALAGISGPTLDFGWLGIYLLAYLPVMALGKKGMGVA